jgi:hypothetical protein
LTLPNNLLRHRLSLLLALLAVFTVAFAGFQPSAMAVCADGAIDSYYSDATYTTQVGECHHECCQLWTCTGQVTMYGRNIRKWSCSLE